MSPQPGRCPKCSGKIVPYTSAENSDAHCMICGYYIAAAIQIVMPEIPPVAAQLRAQQEGEQCLGPF